MVFGGGSVGLMGVCADAALARGGEAIVSKLANFKIESEVVAASVGPAVTQFELRLAENIRVNCIAPGWIITS